MLTMPLLALYIIRVVPLSIPCECCQDRIWHGSRVSTHILACQVAPWARSPSATEEHRVTGARRSSGSELLPTALDPIRSWEDILCRRGTPRLDAWSHHDSNLLRSCWRQDRLGQPESAVHSQRHEAEPWRCVPIKDPGSATQRLKVEGVTAGTCFV